MLDFKSHIYFSEFYPWFSSPWLSGSLPKARLLMSSCISPPGATMALLPSPAHFHPCALPALCSMLMCFPKQKEPQPAQSWPSNSLLWFGWLKIYLPGGFFLFFFFCGCFLCCCFWFFWDFFFLWRGVLWWKATHEFLKKKKTMCKGTIQERGAAGSSLPDTPSAQLFPFSHSTNSTENTILFPRRFPSSVFTSESPGNSHFPPLGRGKTGKQTKK